MLREEDVEMLIDMVEMRPAIYNKTMKEHADINLKKKIWDEICQEIIQNWSDLSPEDKLKAGHEVQKRWQNLRSCFSRELRSQRETKPGQGTKKRRKYVYFERLMFLLPEIESRQAHSNSNEELSLASNDDNENTKNTSPKIFHQEKKFKPTKTENFEESLLKTLEGKKIDEDLHFALSIVPMLRGLSQLSKLDAKIQIMQIFRRMEWPQQ